MRALIVDDEEPAREEMRWLLEQCQGVEVVGSATDFEEAADYFADTNREAEPDLVLLDIDMPGVNGVRVAEWLETSDAAVVFVTAYEEFAVDAFGVDAVDYLLKPVRLERLRDALRRVRRRIEGVDEDEPETSDPLRRISVRPLAGDASGGSGSFRVLELDEVLYFVADNGQVAVETEDGRYGADFQLQELERRLDDSDFFRCHRSYLVRMSAINEIEPKGDGSYRLVMGEDREEVVPLARSRASQLKQRMPWSASLLDTES